MRESKRRERGTCNRRLSRAAADNQSRGPRLTGAEPQAPVVLIVDDEEPIAETAGWIVEAQGYLPLLAYNGQHALELARTRWPAVLITDWMMPQMDGVELIRALHQITAQEGRPRVSTILLSAARVPTDIRAEADAFVSKPFSIEALEALLRQFLEPPSS